jgi:hypothetical protein
MSRGGCTDRAGCRARCADVGSSAAVGDERQLRERGSGGGVPGGGRPGAGGRAIGWRRAAWRRRGLAHGVAGVRRMRGYGGLWARRENRGGRRAGEGGWQPDVGGRGAGGGEEAGRLGPMAEKKTKPSSVIPCWNENP